ncbi:MAG: acetylglutamate kinase [Candidatus Omnitrophota bacterium]|nr:acetylglutamate kinase [Candidatus Omnitrophota bacterium]
MVDEAIKKADVLIEAMPFIRKFNKKIFVIKYGGSILGEERVRKSVLEDIAFLRYTGVRPILVHGGGPNITKKLNSHKKSSQFVDGIRVTDEFTLRVVAEELSKLNGMIVKEISSYGVQAVGLKINSKLLRAQKKQTKVDLGFVGDVVDFDSESLNKIVDEAIPVITPMGISSEGVVYNINADEVACFIAAKLGAQKLVLLTNVLGVMRDPRQNSSLIPTIKVKEAKHLIAKKIIGEGMIPKVNAAIAAIDGGVNKAHIVDARISHAILLEIFTNRGIGTEVVK